VTNNQEVKLAAIEGLWDDQSCAPLFLAGWVNESNQTTKGLSIPCLLSFLSYGDFHATVQGLNSFSTDTWAPVNLAFQAYHLMIDIAMLLALFALLGAGFYVWKQKIWSHRWLLWLFVVSIVFAEAAIISGWWTAEVGRQPWVVWNLLRTTDGVSPSLSTGEVVASLTMFVMLYTVLLVLFLYLLNAKIQRGPEPLEDVEEAPMSSLPDSLRDVFQRHVPLATTSTGEIARPQRGDQDQ
jgi:cytochrome d ubiquinol oxidase subunit I